MSKVFLVGAGPGSLDLLTIKAEKLIKSADCLIYDRLIEDAIIDLAKPECEKIYVGKQAGNHTMKQEDICQLLVQKSKEHECVVRLKGGDVYVFGRGGEEGIALYENNVSFEVVPGISSAIAGLAYAGIPITHRGISRGFHVVTAHDKDDKLANIDFEAMARSDDTCVFLMGLSKIREICDKLLAAHQKEDTPAAVISHATWSTQKTLVGTVKDIADKLDENPLPSPALFVVGDVIKLQKYLSFLDHRELNGCQVLIAHPKGNGTIDTLFRDCGANVTEILTGEIQYHKDALKDLNICDFTHIVCTSRHGAKSLLDAIETNHLDIRSLAGIQLCCVGKKTAQEFEKYHLKADIIPDVYHGDALANIMEHEITKDSKVLFLSGNVYHEKLKQVLNQYGNLTHRIVYENVKKNVDETMDISKFDVMVFTCSSSVQACKKLLTQEKLPFIISMGKETTQTLNQCGINDVATAKISVNENIVEMVKEFWRK